MSGVLAAKVRIVRCPKCEHLLQEHPNFDVYQCGGCGTILKAKKRRSEDVESRSSSHENEAAQRNASDLVSEDRELSHSNQEGIRSSSGECHIPENSGRDIKENEECNEEHLGHVNQSDGEQKNQMEINKLSDLRIKEDVDSEKGCSTEASPDSMLKGENSDAKADNPNSPSMGAEELNDENIFSARVEEVNCTSDGEDANSEKSAELDVTGCDSIAKSSSNPNSPSMGAEELNDENFFSARVEEVNCASDGEDANNEKSAELDVTGCDSIAKSSSTENLASDTENTSYVTAHEPGESIAHVDPVSSPTEQLAQAQTNSDHSFDRVRSADTFDTTEIINPSSELSGTLGEMSKSPTTRSYHAYDGSISSCDGMDEGSPNQHLKPYGNPYTAAKVVSEGRTRRGKIPVNNMTYGNMETQEDPTNFASDFPNRRHHVIEDTERKKSKVLDITGHDRPVQNRVRTERDYYPSRKSFHRSDRQSSYDNGSPSNQLLDEFYCSSSFLSSDAFEDPEQEKVKLLRMIYKLQDQLNRTNGETNGRRSTGVSYKGKHISAYHSHDLHEGRYFHSVDYPGCNGRCNHEINWPQRRNFSWIPFSAEAASSAHHVDHSFFHCRQCSTELPPHVICQREELCRFHQGHNFHFPHRSYPSSPQLFMDSRLPIYSRAAKSGDQMLLAPEVKKYLREKQQHTAKRHFRPVAGGAPFVTCRKCFKLLQLPADFLLFKRVCHQLKCGSCSEVLKFSLQNRSHIVSYSPSALGPPPSELNDQSKEIRGTGSTLPSTSHENHNPHVVRISYSDDYGPSVCKSYSSEDPVLHSNEYGRSVSRSTLESGKRKEKIASRHSSTSKAGLSSDLSGSQKLSSKMEPARSAKTLHRLMGYSSPSLVIRGVRSFFSSTSSRSMENMDDLK